MYSCSLGHTQHKHGMQIDFEEAFSRLYGPAYSTEYWLLGIAQDAYGSQW